MVTLTVTWVKLQSSSIRVIMGIVRVREKHDSAKIIDLISIDIDIFRLNTLKIYLFYNVILLFLCGK